SARRDGRRRGRPADGERLRRCCAPAAWRRRCAPRRAGRALPPRRRAARDRGGAGAVNVFLRRRAQPTADAASAAVTVRTLAVLLQAGAAPRAAWRHLAEGGDATARRITSRIDEGLDAG